MKIKLVFAGDFCSNNPEKILFSKSLKDLLESSDVNCINFEAPLSKGMLISPNGYNLLQSNSSPDYIEKWGFNLISLANNHMCDYGQEGLMHTKQSFKSSITVGAGNWLESYEVKYIEIKGIKIGFFSGTSSDFSSLKDKWEDSNKIGCAWINHYSVNNIISNAKKQCDFLIVISHGGIEFMDVPLPEWRDRYRELIEMGADAIIGSHPHVPQGVENYQGKPIFYSLGNFCFDKNSTNKPLYWDNSILAILEIENNKISFNSIPVVKKENSIDLDVSEKTVNHHNYLSEILKDDNKYIEKVNTEVLRLYDKYYTWILFSAKAIEVKFSYQNLIKIIKTLVLIKKNEKTLLHQIREESTRWLIIRALKLKTKSAL